MQYNLMLAKRAVMVCGWLQR